MIKGLSLFIFATVALALAACANPFAPEDPTILDQAHTFGSGVEATQIAGLTYLETIQPSAETAAKVDAGSRYLEKLSVNVLTCALELDQTVASDKATDQQITDKASTCSQLLGVGLDALATFKKFLGGG